MSFPIVGIGASAGGLEALVELLTHLPADTGLAFLIVQHLDASHSSLLSEILGKKTSMPVREAAQGLAIEPNHAYVIPPNTSMTVDGDHLVLRQRTKLGPPMPVDDLFESLADKGVDAIGVILSGSGSDGALAMRAIKGEGGTTYAQDPKTARFTGMPQAAISQGGVDFVLPPRAIAEHLGRLGRRLSRAAPQVTRLAEPVLADEDNLKRIFRRLRTACNIDFTHYKRGTVTRRLARRLALHDLESAAEYLEFLDANPGEVQAFCKDLLIRVTGFFRDPDTFEALTHTVFPRVLEGRAAQTPLRIWVPGCASGEEVYSIAICLVEYLGERVAETPIQIFGTDISEDAIETARAGLFIENIERNVSEERLRRFFVRVDAHYRVAKSIRDICIFSRQDVTRDPPFSRIDVVSCRNLLIYLTPELQKRVVPVFHYALNPNGLLMLGASETIGSYSDLFRPLDDKKFRIYQKKNLSGRPPLELRDRGTYREPEELKATKPAPPLSDMEHLQREADRVALSRYTPAGVLCDEELNILQFRGDTGPFLAHPPGTASLDLRKLVRADLLVHIGGAIQEARKNGVPVRRPDLRLETPSGLRTFDLEVIPIQQPTVAGCCFLIFFAEQPQPPNQRRVLQPINFWARLSAAAGSSRPRRVPARDNDSEVARLAQELETSREYVRTLIEEHESANEELKSAQEELLSSNEEFQSTNEELETAKEELQSANEELSTTNDELRYRNRELNALNDDLLQARDYADAIVETVRQPLVVLDVHLRVVRANRAFYAAFKTTQQDTEHGLIYELGQQQWNIPGLRRLLEETLPLSAAFEDYEVSGAFPRIGHRTMRLNGRRLSWSGHSLILLAIEDVTERHAATSALQENERRKNEFLAMLAHELRNPLAAIRNALEIWRRGDAGAAAEKQAQAMLDRQLRKETRLVDDLLDVSRITRGVITLNKAPVDLAQAVNEAIEETRSLLDDRRHELKLALPVEPVIVLGDATRLEQIIANLLSNSIKFTEPGGVISVTLERAGQEAVLSVADNGIGIAAEMLPNVFDLFVQADRSVDRSQGGLGLGLTLVHRLLELHGGTIGASSAGLKQGSEFVVRLPVLQGVRRVAPKTQAPKRTRVIPRRILVVDDNSDTAQSIAVLLRLDGHQVEVTADGVTALAAAVNFKPEVVLLDIGLPGLDGYEVAQRLREMPEAREALLIAISGYGGAEDRRRSKQAGFTHHLVKPVDPNTLDALLANTTTPAVADASDPRLRN